MKLVKLRTRPSRNGRTFVYMLDYVNEQGQRRRISCGHCDKRRAELERKQKIRELRMNLISPEPMKLRAFVKDSLERTGQQIRESTRVDYSLAARCFISVVGNIDYQQVSLRHAEIFRKTCLEQGNANATVAKKLRSLRRLFQLAVDRGMLDVNPFVRIAMPKSAKRKIHIYSTKECQSILQTARDYQMPTSIKWELLILMALTTGMRKNELLNTTWADIDFDAKTIEVNPKKNTKETWAWDIKDTDRRRLPLTDKIISMLAEHQSLQPESCPYVFMPISRYKEIQKKREKRQRIGTVLINNFTRKFRKILKKAKVESGTFHDLRRTALSNLLAGGLGEYDVMKIAGHSNFNTTHEFYLSVSDNLVDKTRKVCSDLARAWHAPPIVDKRV